MPVFSKPIQPTSTEDLPRSSRKRTLNPKLATEDNVHPQAKAIKWRKLEAGASTSQSNSNKNSAKRPKPPTKKSGGPTSHVKSHGQKEFTIEDDEDIIMHDKEDDEEDSEEDDGEKIEDEEEEKEDDDELQVDNDKSQDSDEDTESNDVDLKELGMLRPPS